MEINNSEENKKDNSINQEEKQSNITTESKKSNSKKIVNPNEKKETEEELIKKDIKKDIKKESGKGKKQKKIVTQKMKKKTKSNVNPFILENNNEHRQSKKLSKHVINKNSIRSSYLLHYKSEISDLKEQNPNKSAFSKISEIMYEKSKEEKFPKKKERDLQKEEEEKYDKFTEEAFLISQANKTNRENKKIINEFLERKKKEELADKVGIESEKEKENELESFQDNKRGSILTDRNTSFKSKRTFNEFLEDQKAKEEKHQEHLKTSQKEHNDKLSSIILDKPVLNEETIKIANKGKRNDNIGIHQRLFDEYNEIKQKKEKIEKERYNLNKREEKKIPKANIQKNIERLFAEYEVKKKRVNENIMKKEKEIRNRSSNRSSSKSSNQIIFKRFKKILENGIKNVLEKNLEETFEINFSNFTKLLYKINFTSKNYFELIEEKEKDEKEEANRQSIKSNSRKVLFIKNKLELDREYRLMTDAWKIITKNKEFKIDALGTSERIIIFFLSVLGIYDGNNLNDFIKKEFSFLIKEEKDNNKYSNLSKQIYKYFAVFKNNAINGLLFREKNNKRKIEIAEESERLLTFSPNLETSSKNYISASNSVNHMRLSVEKNYAQLKKNKELKLKEKEKFLEEEEKEKCPFYPSGAKNNEKKDIEEISKRLFSTGLKHLKLSNSTQNNVLYRDQIYNSYTENNHRKNKNFQKMFNNNPLEADFDVKKKLLEMEESRNQKALEKLILKKGYIPKENKKDIILFDEDNNKSGRFALEDERSNTFKNTFERYERFDKRNSSIPNKERFEFEITVERKPRKLILYQGDDINCKVKDFCKLYKLNYTDKRTILKAINQQMNNQMNIQIKF